MAESTCQSSRAQCRSKDSILTRVHRPTIAFRTSMIN